MFKIPNSGKSSSDDASNSGSVGSFDLNNFSVPEIPFDDDDNNNCDEKPKRRSSDTAVIYEAQAKRLIKEPQGKPNRRMSGSSGSEISADGDKPKRRNSDTAVIYKAQTNGLISEPQDKPTKRISGSSAIANIFKSKKKLAGAEVFANGDKPKRRSSDTAVIYEAQAKGLIKEPQGKPNRRMSGSSASEISADGDKPKRRNSDTAVIYKAQANGLISEPQDKPTKRISGSSAIADIFKSKKKRAEEEVSADGDKPKRTNLDTAVIYEAQAKRLITEPQDKPARRMSGGVIGKPFKSRKKPAEAEDKPKRRGSESALSKTVKTKSKSSDTGGKSKVKIPKSRRGSGSYVSLRRGRKLGKEIDDDSTKKSSKSNDNSVPSTPKSPLSLEKPLVSPHVLAARKNTKKKNAITNDKRSMFKIPNTSKSSTDDASDTTGTVSSFDHLSDSCVPHSSAAGNKAKRANSETAVICEAQAKGLKTEPQDKPVSRMSGVAIGKMFESKEKPEAEISTYSEKPKRRNSKSTIIYEAKGLKTEPQDKPARRRSGRGVIANIFKSKKKRAEAGISANGDKPKRRNSDTSVIYEAKGLTRKIEPGDKPAKRKPGSVVGKLFNKSKKKRAGAEVSTDGDKPKRRNSETAVIYEAKGLITEPQDKPARRIPGAIIGKLFKSRKTPAEEKPNPGGSESALSKAVKTKNKSSDKEGKPNEKIPMNRGSGSSVSRRGERKSVKETDDGSTVASDKSKKKSPDSFIDKPKRRGSTGAATYKGSKKIRSERGADDSSTVRAPRPKRNAGMGKDVSVGSINKPKKESTVGSATGKDAKSKLSKNGDNSTTAKKRSSKNPGKSKSTSDSVSSKKNKRKAATLAGTASTKELKSEVSEHSPKSSEGAGKKKVRSRRAEREINEENEKRRSVNSSVSRDKLRKKKVKLEKRRAVGDNDGLDRLAIATPDLRIEAFSTDGEALGTISLNDATSTNRITQEEERCESDLLSNKLQSLDKAIKERQERKEFANATAELMQLRMEHQKAVEERRRLKTDLDTGRSLLKSLTLELKPLKSKC